MSGNAFSARGIAAAASIAATLLLSACGSVSLLPSTEQAEKAGDAAAATPGSGKRARMGSRTAQKGKGGPGGSPLEDAFEEPEYSQSIREIMANATCHSCEEKPYHQMVMNASNRHGVPASLIHAVIQKESGYNPSATSGRRARGLMQITPEAARSVGIRDSSRLYDPQTNIYAGTAYLKYLLANHETIDEALAAYNSGPGNVRRYKGVPPFKETKRYVREVKKIYSTAAQ